MKKQSHADEMKKDVDIMISKINAFEVVASGEYKQGVVNVLRALVEGQVHTINEFEHLKKAIDLLTLQLFETQNKIRS